MKSRDQPETRSSVIRDNSTARTSSPVYISFRIDQKPSCRVTSHTKSRGHQITSPKSPLRPARKPPSFLARYPSVHLSAPSFPRPPVYRLCILLYLIQHIHSVYSPPLLQCDTYHCGRKAVIRYGIVRIRRFEPMGGGRRVWLKMGRMSPMFRLVLARRYLKTMTVHDELWGAKMTRINKLQTRRWDRITLFPQLITMTAVSIFRSTWLPGGETQMSCRDLEAKQQQHTECFASFVHHGALFLTHLAGNASACPIELLPTPC